MLVTGSSDGTAKLWDFEEPAPGSTDQALRLGRKPASIAHKSIDSGKKAITALVWHPDGTVFATGKTMQVVLRALTGKRQMGLAACSHPLGNCKES